MGKVLLGVTGGIAAYKAAELARILIRGGQQVQVVMTEAAASFITPLTFKTLTGRPALLDMFSPLQEEIVRHVSLAEEAAVMVVAPASANTLAKMAQGIADNLLTTLYLAVECPVVLVPSMNDAMYKHPAVQDNLDRLRRRGCNIMDPSTGDLACGAADKGRLPEPADISLFIRSVLMKKDFSGIKALVTAGPTREHLDPVRFLSNPSSGMMGYALALALAGRGAQVTLVSGPASLDDPPGVEKISVVTGGEMRRAVLARYGDCHLVIKAAAVSDYRPEKTSAKKIKKGEARISVNFVANDDILKELGSKKGNCFLVGFAAETDDAMEHGHKKLREKGLDLIVVNDLTLPGAGFASRTNKSTLIDRNGEVEELPMMDKEDMAHRILDRIAELM